MAANYLPYARVTTGNPQTTLDAAAKNPVGAIVGSAQPLQRGNLLDHRRSFDCRASARRQSSSTCTSTTPQP